MIATYATLLGTFAALAVVLGAELAARIAAGDSAALHSAYQQHAGRVLAIALRIVRSKEEAEDVVQDTFLEVWRRAREFDGSRGEFSAWVTSMARSRCIDRVRRARVRALYVAREPSVGVSERPDEHVSARQHGEKVRRVLEGLPSEQRDALELAYFEGLTQQQIAERTGLPLGTVKTRLRLALEKLSPKLEELR